MRLFGSAYLVSPCSSAPFRWGRRSCLGLRTGVSPHFSMNSMREILALRGGYERGRVPLPSPMPPESGAPPHNTHPSMVPLSLCHSRRPCVYSSLFSLSHCLSHLLLPQAPRFESFSSSSHPGIDLFFRKFHRHRYHCIYHENIIQDHQTPRSLAMSS